MGNGLLLTKKNLHNYVEGFTTDKGLMVDLDRVTYSEVYGLALNYLNRFKLEGFIILQTSSINYHVVFNRYLSWRKVCEYLCKIAWFYSRYRNDIIHGFTYWVLLQICKGSATLRISKKGRKRKPRIVSVVGETDKLIRDYLQYYDVGE